MMRDDKKLLNAMHIFEALSGVEGPLLEKSEQETPRRIISWQGMRYAATLIAAACVLIVCFTWWQDGGYQNAATDSAKEEAAPMAGAENLSAATEGGGMAEAVEEGAVEEGAVEEDAMAEDSIEVDMSCMKDSRFQITEAEATQIELLGDYVPTTLPEGYVWESGSAMIPEEVGECTELSLMWTRGLDNISLYISFASEQEIQLVDVAETETYDVRLYEIPYADTVPSEYRQIFDLPVFAEKDFSLGTIEARMKVVEDAGDTKTPRGGFGVYYEEGVLVRFNGRGTAKEIWELFQSMIKQN